MQLNVSEFPSVTQLHSEMQLAKAKRRMAMAGRLGIMYENKVLMLGLYRAIKAGYDFTLDANVEGVASFEDVVFTYKEKDGVDRRVYLDVKHVRNEEKKMRYHSLMNAENRDYALYKHFVGYAKTVKNFKDVDNKYFIMYTNVDFGCPKEDAGGLRKLQKSDEEYFLFKKLNLSDHKPLDIFSATDSECSKKSPAFYQFSDLDEKGDDVKSRVVDFLREKFKVMNHTSENNIRKMLPTLTESEFKLMLEGFFESLVFAVDQLNQDKLGDQLKRCIQRDHLDCLTESHVDYIFDFALSKINQWKVLVKAKPLTEKDNFFNEGAKKFKPFSTLNPALMDGNKLNAFHFRFQREKYEEVHEFVTSKDKLWVISSGASWVHKLVIYQALMFENSEKFTEGTSTINYSHHGNRLFVTWSELLESPEHLMDAFESMEQCLLIIVSESADYVEPETLQVVQKMIRIVSSSASKKIIVIAPEDFELPKLLKRFLSSFDPNKNLVLVPT